MYVPSLKPEQLDGFNPHSVPVFKSLSIIRRRLLNMNILAPQTGAYQMTPRNKMATFSETAVTVLIKL
jgi:hypothetical protein